MYDQLLFGYNTGVNGDRIVTSKEADYLLVCLHLCGHFGCPFLALSLLRISGPVQTSNFTCAELNARVKCM